MEILLKIELTDDKSPDIEDIEQTLLNDFENVQVGGVKVLDAKILKDFFNSFEDLTELHEQFNNKVEDINHRQTFWSEPITPEKWDYLDRYYISPLNDMADQAAEKFYKFMED